MLQRTLNNQRPVPERCWQLLLLLPRSQICSVFVKVVVKPGDLMVAAATTQPQLELIMAL